MKRVAAAIMMLGACLTSVAIADHCPDDKIASGDPELSLGGISFGDDDFEQVRARLGQPSKHDEGRDDDYSPGAGWAEYEWTRGHTKLTLSTEFFTSDSGTRVESLESISVSGSSSPQVPGTGRGLKLGDDLERAVKLYGPTYFEGAVNGPKLGERTVTYCFSDETELSLGLNKAGRVVAIRLSPSEE